MEGEAVDWSSYDLTLEIMTPSHSKETIHFTSNGTELTFKYKPNQIGQYFLSAFINRFKEDEQALDVKLFEGVRWSFLQENEDEDLMVETINLSGDIREGHIDLRRYYTKDEIDFNFYTKEEIEANKYLTSIPSEYVTEEELEDKDYVSNAELNAKGYLTYIPSEYVTEEELIAKKYLTSVPSEYVTETELEAKNYATKADIVSVNQNLDSYYTKDEINSKNFITSSYLDSKGYITVIPDNYITSTQLEAKGYLTSVPSEYVTESELKAKGYLTAIPSEYITEDKLTAKGYLKAVPSEYITETELAYKNYATKPELNAFNDKFDQYYSKSDIDSKNYVTTTYLASRGYLTSVPDHYVTSTQMQSVMATSERNLEKTLLDYYNKEQVDSIFDSIPKEVIDLSNYYTKYEVQGLIDKVNTKDIDLTGYYTKEEIDNKHFIQVIPEKYITEEELLMKDYVNHSEFGRFNESIKNEYCSKDELYELGIVTIDYLENRGYLTGIPSKYVTEDELAAKGFLTAIPSQYITESELEAKKYLTAIPSQYITKDQLYALGYLQYIPEEYVTKDYLTENGYVNQIQLQLLKERFDSYYTKTQIDNKGYLTADMLDNKGYLTAIPSEYVTETELAYMNYATKSELTNVSKLFDSYYTKADIDAKQYLTAANFNDYYNKTEVDDKIYNTITNLSGYYNKTQTDEKFYSKAEIDAKGYLTSVPNEVITEAELSSLDYADKNYVISMINNKLGGNILPTNYYTKDEIHNSYYNKSQIAALLDNITVGDGQVDLTNYYTKSEIDDLLENIPDDDLSNYYTKSEIDDLLDNIEIGEDGDGQTDLSDYYTKREVDGLLVDWLVEVENQVMPDYYTKAEVNSLIGNGSGGNTTIDPSVFENYYTKTEIDAKGYLTDIPSEYVTETELESYKYLTEDELNEKIITKEDLHNYVQSMTVSNLNVITTEEYNNLETTVGNILYILI